MHPNDPDNFRDPLEGADLSRAEAAAAIYAIAREFGFNGIVDAAWEEVEEALLEGGVAEGDLDEGRERVEVGAKNAIGVLKHELTREIEINARRDAARKALREIVRAA